ncbi:MAG: hypothetical protein A2020_12190 [Lentisphaerae bacterium GWF2_45_14]|nr:MAG: hypothetical protein A2020_12190 [Lentisphaerae bacterium GWF2_45_14]
MALKDLSVKTMKIFNMDDAYENQQVTNGASDSIRILNAKLEIDSSLPVIFNQMDTDENQQVTNKLVDAVKELEKSFATASGLNVNFSTKAYPIINKNDNYENMDVTNRLVAVIDEISVTIEKYLDDIASRRSGEGKAVEAEDEPGSSSMSDTDALYEFGGSSEHWDIVGRCMCSDPECHYDCSSGDIMVIASGTYSTACDESGNHLIKLAGPFESYEAAYTNLYANYAAYEEMLLGDCESPCDGLRIQGSLTKNCSGECYFDICIPDVTSDSYISTTILMPGTHYDNCGNPFSVWMHVGHTPGTSLRINTNGLYGTGGSVENCCWGYADGSALQSNPDGEFVPLAYPAGSVGRNWARFGSFYRWSGGTYEYAIAEDGNCKQVDESPEGSFPWSASYRFSE